MIGPVLHNVSLFSDLDICLFLSGHHPRIYEKLGAHFITHEDHPGIYFAVWAPNAEKVSVVGDFNSWQDYSHFLACRSDGSGIWEGFIPGIENGSKYKFFIQSKLNGYKMQKADPMAFMSEQAPCTSSILCDLKYSWNDSQWMKEREKKNNKCEPLSIYELHLGSWRGWKNYREIAHELTDYVKKMGFTHVEFLPIMEHPFYGSWGYQILGYFAPTSRYGTPQDFMYLIDYLHQNNIGVILDWVVAHFPEDDFGLAQFDGSYLYEHENAQMRYHPDWGSLIFNYGKGEVASFLKSTAIFWLDKYHIDGLRVDAVASMLYLDYSRKPGEWIPNKYGGNENLDAIEFLKTLNVTIHEDYPSTITIAEESTAWPMVTRSVDANGLGFDYKWNMGWMHDTLTYFSKDSIFRQFHLKEITFSMFYAYHENFILVLSHDEMVYGKGSLINKMPGDDWQKHANLRLMLGYQYTHPGKKLLFMGSELAQESEWDHDSTLTWGSQDILKIGLKNWVIDLNNLYRTSPAMFEMDYDFNGFEWIGFNDYENTVISYTRKSANELLLVISNTVPIARENYAVGAPVAGTYTEILNSDDIKYGGKGMINSTPIKTETNFVHNHNNSLQLKIPPLGLVILKLSEATT